ncbi:MAG: arginine decarboxylase, pyruvoyl-dependent [Bacillota bacterium]
MHVPGKYTLVAGVGEGEKKLTAFDAALLDAGIGNYNLIKVSSILPPGAKRMSELDVPPGALLPAAFGTIVSDIKGERLAAAVGVGVSKDSFGMIMEYASVCSKEEAVAKVKQMVEEAFANRGMEIQELWTMGAEHVVDRVGAVIAAVALWD